VGAFVDAFLHVFRTDFGYLHIIEWGEIFVC
jgi:hypothetical protein